MNVNFQERLIYLILALPAFVVAFTVHEFAHAYTAYRLGDDTAKRAGKLSLDPFKMMDPIGSLFLVVTILMGGPLIGWAWVPVNRRNFANPRRDSILVSAAGPASNVVQGFVWFFILLALRIGAQMAGHHFGQDEMLSIVNRQENISTPLLAIMSACAIGVTLNFALAIFNMLPVPPFDGGFIAEEIVPELKPIFDSIRPFAYMFIFFVANYTPVLQPIMTPVEHFASDLVLRAFGENPALYSYG